MDKKIIIIGAGASGVAAATKLVSNGFKDVTILEGENRLGGRVNTVNFGKNVVEIGAQWCHGEKNNVVYEMATAYDPNIFASTGEVFENLVRSNGEEIPLELQQKLLKLCNDISEGDEYSEEMKNYPGSKGNFFANKFREALKTDEFKDVKPEWRRELFETFHSSVISVDGADSWYDTACNEHDYEACEGDVGLNWKDKGYVTIFNLLQNKMPGSTKPVIDVIPLIKFNTTVTKIKYDQPDGMVKIECEDGTSYSADHVICTVSVGVLKEQHWQLFEPLLSQDKIDSIDGLGIGTADKIFLEFEKPFWPENWRGCRFLWRKEEIKAAREDPVNGDWLSGYVGFTPVNKLNPNVLLGWVMGAEAHKMEQKSDADVKAGSEKLLRMFFKQYDIPDAKAFARSKWYSNPHFRGSYSNNTLKAEALGATPYKLAEPVNDKSGKPVVQFAGEATSGNHYSCVHGAIETGWREADRLIKLYK